ncbi:MAG: hypothetical protein VYC34_03510 [Planctomycetota bacterium]|nr:hypothetical protein [Planctomycetota bacterium]
MFAARSQPLQYPESREWIPARAWLVDKREWDAVGMETDAHLLLKFAGIRHLTGLGCRVAACEVQCPIARYRLDVAGYVDRAAPREEDGTLWGGAGTGETAKTWTVIIECKQARGDFLRDRRDLERVLRVREALERRKRDLEVNVIRASEAHLREAGSSLFPEMERWAYERSASPGYRRILERIEVVERRLYGGTKFCRMSRWRLADRLYLIAPRGVVRAREVPPGWGLLECAAMARGRRGLRIGVDPTEDVRVVVEAPDLGSPPKRRLRLLRNIGAAATRASIAAMEVERAGAGASRVQRPRAV